MKAAIINQFGSADELKIAEVERPEPGPDQVVIGIKAASINPVDTKIRSGKHISCKDLKLPSILGKDFSGTIELLGENVTGFQVGDAVFGCSFGAGTYAEYLAIESSYFVKKPANASFEEAAAVPLVALTAYQAVHEHLNIKPDQRILIHAAAGGVGHLAVQFAKLTGAYVYGTASEANATFLKRLGIDETIDYKNEQFEERASDLDAVIDAMGGDVLYRSISCVKPGGTVVCLPSSTKNDPKAVALALEKDVRLIWPMMHPDRDQLELFAQLIRDEKLRVHVDKAYSLNDIARAHTDMESHKTRGKLVVVIGMP
ncbi:NADP-dependent oxidoreductase [Arcticibacter sp.]|uniref:NADP-dependent oxidoreductase n=1 Tax=Arcticibacter sp. TaxID=1872630 RepID=UPI003890AEE6